VTTRATTMPYWLLQIIIDHCTCCCCWCCCWCCCSDRCIDIHFADRRKRAYCVRISQFTYCLICHRNIHNNMFYRSHCMSSGIFDVMLHACVEKIKLRCGQQAAYGCYMCVCLVGKCCFITENKSVHGKIKSIVNKNVSACYINKWIAWYKEHMWVKLYANKI